MGENDLFQHIEGLVSEKRSTPVAGDGHREGRVGE